MPAAARPWTASSARAAILSGGQVERSILGPNVRVNSFAAVEDSILLEGVDIGRHARVRRAIIDKGVRIPPGTHIGFDQEHDRARGFTVSEGGVVVIAKADGVDHFQEELESIEGYAPGRTAPGDDAGGVAARATVPVVAHFRLLACPCSRFAHCRARLLRTLTPLGGNLQSTVFRSLRRPEPPAAWKTCETMGTGSEHAAWQNRESDRPRGACPPFFHRRHAPCLKSPKNARSRKPTC